VIPGPFTWRQLDNMADAKLREDWKLSAVLRLTIRRSNGDKKTNYEDLYPFEDE
jgi:hypothetical protein